MSFNVGDRVRVVDTGLPLAEAAVVEGKTGIIVNNDTSILPWFRVLMDEPLPEWLTTEKTVLFYPQEIELVS